MRLLQLTPVYQPALSGSALLFQKLSEGLVARGHEVTVVTSNALDYRGFWERDIPVNNLPEEETVGGVLVKRLPVRRRHSCANYWRLVHYTWKYRLPGSDWLRTWYDGPLLDFSTMCGEICNARPRAYEVVCAGHTPSMMVVDGHGISRRLEAPYVVIPGLHTDNTFNTERRNITRILRAADHLCANTTFEREVLLKLTGGGWIEFR